MTGPTFAQVGAAERGEPDARPVVTKSYDARAGASAPGRSWVYIVCPFCSAYVRTYLWSLAGGGKRCECGALFGSGGQAHQWAATA